MSHSPHLWIILSKSSFFQPHSHALLSFLTQYLSSCSFSCIIPSSFCSFSAKLFSTSLFLWLFPSLPCSLLPYLVPWRVLSLPCHTAIILPCFLIPSITHLSPPFALSLHIFLSPNSIHPLPFLFWFSSSNTLFPSGSAFHFSIFFPLLFFLTSLSPPAISLSNHPLI